jgi:hypothetical protein
MMILRHLLSGVLLASMLLSSGCTKERIAFKKLHRVRRDPDAARPLAESLMKTEQGVQLALDDFDCFGGTTRGWSSWIIEHTPITNVNERLDSIMGDPAFEESKRISAAWLLWRRTNEDRCLEELSLWLVNLDLSPWRWAVTGLRRRQRTQWYGRSSTFRPRSP